MTPCSPDSQSRVGLNVLGPFRERQRAGPYLYDAGLV
jgi:hypothetical protein